MRPRLPKLPPISQNLLNEVFVNKAPADVPVPSLINNDKLAWLGDASISLCATNLLYAHTNSRDMNQLNDWRERIVCNAQLSSWATSYGFQHRLLRCQAVYPSTKMRATALEAYAGAVHLELGHEAAHRWLSKLIVTTRPFTETEEIEEPDVTIDESVLVASDPFLKENYEEIKKLSMKVSTTFLRPFQILELQRIHGDLPVECEITEKHVGAELGWKCVFTVDNEQFEGLGSTKQRAKNVAALAALRKIKLVWGSGEST